MLSSSFIYCGVSAIIKEKREAVNNMPKNLGQKQKLYQLAKIFFEETDFDYATGEMHGFTLSQLIDKLSLLGIPVERKTLYSDFKELRNIGVDISSVKKGRSTVYYSASLPFGFELSELKILVDSVQAAKFISERQSNAIINKIEQLCSKHQKAQLNHNLSMSGRVKTMNSSSIYAVDSINRAINSDSRVSFDYYKWTVREAALQKKNKVYIVDPIALVWEDENYYLIAYNSAEEEPLRHYRVDKMKNVEILDEKRDCAEFLKSFQVNEYIQSVFGMYGGEEERTISIKAETGLIGVFRDRFSELNIVNSDEKSFVAQVSVRVSDQFFGWLFGLGNGVEILEPVDVKQKYINALNERLKSQN